MLHLYYVECLHPFFILRRDALRDSSLTGCLRCQRTHTDFAILTLPKKFIFRRLLKLPKTSLYKFTGNFLRWVPFDN